MFHIAIKKPMDILKQVFKYLSNIMETDIKQTLGIFLNSCFCSNFCFSWGTDMYVFVTPNIKITQI